MENTHIETPIETLSNNADESKQDNLFKKPILIGKIGKLPKKLSGAKSEPKEDVEAQKLVENIQIEPKVNKVIAPAQQVTENSIPLPYKEPDWSGLPETDGKDYSFDVLKNGSIIESINLMTKPFWVFGRLANCSVCLQHPTISRYHAILQYRQKSTETDSSGFYIYDLGSTHGTFLNKKRLKPKIFVKMQVGHMLKLGCSTRSFILNGPEYDEEEESELSVTELKRKRDEDAAKREEEKLRIEKEIEEKKKREEERGIDWGLGEDADEENDLSENPYASTNNEELYLDDPKKALRGFFEREGLNLEYDCNEQGMGQFLCRVELPLDDETGRPIVAEVLHKGKKKEAVIQCALEACRILDRHGVLRQATHESRKRKAKNWEENDYYDSDEDTFLDRTGTIEKKREKRMNAKVPQKVETYESLLEKEKSISNQISQLENRLKSLQTVTSKQSYDDNEEDSLDTFMKDLTDVKSDKTTISNIKMELNRLRNEHTKIVRLVNIAKPANLPDLVTSEASTSSTSKDTKKNLPIFGKRKKIQVKYEDKSNYKTAENDLDDEEEIAANNNTESENTENINNDDSEIKNEGTEINNEVTESLDDPSSTSQDSDDQNSSSSDGSDDESKPFMSLKDLHNTMTFKKFEAILKKGLPSYAVSDKHQDKLVKILNNLKKMASSEDRMNVDWKMLFAKKKKVMKLIKDMKQEEHGSKLEHRISSELNRILIELNSMSEQKQKVLGKVKKMGNEIHNISQEIEKEFEEFKNRFNDGEEPSISGVVDERKKKKNMKRMEQKRDKVEQERQRGYEEDAERDDYCMWVPPNDQAGDGRTSLNDKFGY